MCAREHTRARVRVRVRVRVCLRVRASAYTCSNKFHTQVQSNRKNENKHIPDQKSRPWLHTCWRALAPCVPAHLLYFQSGKAVTRTPLRPSRDYQGNNLVQRNSLLHKSRMSQDNI